jgi:nucleotide-binding universal stress UspA family protein
MYRSILVPLDGSVFGEQALPWALCLARRCGAALTLMHVHAPIRSVYLEGAIFLDESLETDLRDRQQTYLQGVANRLRRVRPDMPVAIKIVEGEVAQLLAAEVASHGADLVVMTTHGRGPLGRFWLGSVADLLVRQSPAPVLLIRPGKAAVDLGQEPMLKHVLVPLDGTLLAEQILEPAMTMAKLMEAGITLARIVKPVVPVSYPVEAATMTQAVQSIQLRVEQLQAQLLDEARKYLDTVAARVRTRGFSVETLVDIEQQPAVAILHAAGETNRSLIALETHGRRGLSRLFLGSVADKVIRGAGVPVLVHRPIH